jgi:hypothetical protein
MKIMIAAIIGALAAAGFIFSMRYFTPHEVLASSISPDSKWICEIVDINPRGPVCMILIHGQSYQGRTKLKRGYRGECVVMDMDSSGPPKVTFDWSGSVVTISSQDIGLPVRLECSKNGARIIQDEKPSSPD